MKTIIDEKQLIEDYSNGLSFSALSKKYKIGTLKVGNILKDNNIRIRQKTDKKIERNFLINDYHIKKYENTNEYHYVAKSKIDGSEFCDCNNDGGHLTSHIREKLGIEIPTLYDRRIYYQTTGNYWWEQWFDVIKVENKPTKKCPYCDWETVDIDNKSGVFEQHLKEQHNITLEMYLKEYPSDIEYFNKYKRTLEHEEKKKQNGYGVVCPICGKVFEKLTKHIETHGLTMEEFREKYPDSKILSDNMKELSTNLYKLGNLSVNKNRFISKYKKEIQEFLDNNNIEYMSNRQILDGKEIDILIPSLKIGIEFDGLKWHTEWFGKKRHNYHLEKTIKCNENGYGLIHIFEDEYVNHKEIVYSKLSHLLGLDINLPKIMGRKCIVKEIYKFEAKEFLEKYHIQGYVSSTVYLGAYYNNELIAVMSFKNGNVKNPNWELTRFASNYNYRCQGVASKMFSFFVKQYNPYKVVSFADRRWTINTKQNLYTNLDFDFIKFTPPDYRYYIDESKNDKKYKRIHKMQMTKKILSTKYNLPIEWTEWEMAKHLGYDRIWDCGLLKYVWTNKTLE